MNQNTASLIETMLFFCSKANLALLKKLSEVKEARNLTERDLYLLEWLVDRDITPYSEAVKYVVNNNCQCTDGLSEPIIHVGISNMKRLGLIRTTRTKADERKKTISITPKGRVLVKRRLEIRERFMQETAKHLECDDRTKKQLYDVLVKSLSML